MFVNVTIKYVGAASTSVSATSGRRLLQTVNSATKVLDSTLYPD